MSKGKVVEIYLSLPHLQYFARFRCNQLSVQSLIGRVIDLPLNSIHFIQTLDDKRLALNDPVIGEVCQKQYPASLNTT